VIELIVIDSLGLSSEPDQVLVRTYDPTSIQAGDVNGDGIVDLTDAILVLQVLAGIEPSSTVYVEADVNGDGRIGIAELTYILQKIAGFRQTFVESILFQDDFEDNSIDPAKWTHTGNRVVEENGLMKVEVTVTDDDGMLYSRWIEIDPEAVLIIERKVNIYYANEYYSGTFHVLFEGAPELTFGGNYLNYSYSGGAACPSFGFFLTRNGANARHCDDANDISAMIDPVWDEWFEEKFVYNPITGILEYHIDDQKLIEYNVGPLPQLSSYNIQLFSRNFAWYTGHYQHMDDITVKQFLSDSDNDGVPDDQDICPNTPIGEPVDETGCSIAQLLIPVLFFPSADALLDNGCTDFSDPLIWDFDWSEVPGATAYHLYVIASGYQIPVIDDEAVVSSSYHFESGYAGTGPFLWKVRANVDGIWRDWSEERTFYAEPVDTDCP
jgi:hypothetical protein